MYYRTWKERRRRIKVASAAVVVVLLLTTADAAADQPEGGTRIGRSVEGRPIFAYTVGSGSRAILMVGGIHGGYEANSIKLAREFLRYYRENPNALADQFTLHIIDNMNPDGLFRVTGGVPIDEFDFRSADTEPGRFNANFVDLNRNWDGDWQPTSYWRNREVDAGSAPFSEPETRAVRDYLLEIDPVVSIFFQSAAAGIWYSGAEELWEPARRLAESYAAGSGYRMPRPDTGTVGYEITGSADDYFVEIGHPNITVELTTHYDIDWEQNLAGFRSLLEALQDR